MKKVSLLFIFFILIFTVTGCWVDGNEKQTKIEKPIDNVYNFDFGNISIEKHIKSKLDPSLIKLLKAVKQFEVSPQSDNDRNRMNSYLNMMSKRISIDFKKDDPTVGVLIETNDADRLIKDSKIVDEMIYKNNKNNFLAETRVKIIDLEYLAELDCIIRIFASQIPSLS
jgi:hypothetical protein